VPQAVKAAALSPLSSNPALIRSTALFIKATAQPHKSWSAKAWEMVYADLNDEDSLADAFSGAATIFTVTDFFESFAVSGPDAAMKIEY